MLKLASQKKFCRLLNSKAVRNLSCFFPSLSSLLWRLYYHKPVCSDHLSLAEFDVSGVDSTYFQSASTSVRCLARASTLRRY